MAHIDDRALDPEEASEFESFTGLAADLLQIDDWTAPAASIAGAIDDYVDRLQQEVLSGGSSISDEDAVVHSLALGIAFGNQVAREFGWEWRCVLDDGENYAVISPDRAMAMYPTYFVKACMDDPALDCTLMLAFNMLAAERFEASPREYADILGQAVRIVPRR